MPTEVVKFILKAEVCGLAKSSIMSKIHRPTYYDYVLIKEFDEKNKVIIVHRFLGLYTSTVYRQFPLTIPIIRQKVESVLVRSGLSRDSHNGKDLLQVLTVFPRDELIQSSCDDLFYAAIEIMHIQERRRIRLFIRKDCYGNFFSCLVYVPRDIYSTDIRIKTEKVLSDSLSATDVEFYTYFSESVLARTHFILRGMDVEKITFNTKRIEERLIHAIRSWEDTLHGKLVDSYGEEQTVRFSKAYQNAFSGSYKDDFEPSVAVMDIKHIDRLCSNRNIEMTFYRRQDEQDELLRFKLFNLNEPLVLSDIIPILENLGLKVISERPYEARKFDGTIIWIHDFGLCYGMSEHVNINEIKHIFQQAFAAILNNEAENDAFNRIIIGSKLSWRQVVLLRAYARYMKQIEMSFSENFIANTMTKNLKITKLIIQLFETLFEPDQTLKNSTREKRVNKLERAIVESIDQVANLSEDKVLRQYLHLIKSTLRTNYFQKNTHGHAKDYLSFKFLPKLIPEIPKPCPEFEIFVYSPVVEGVHLRGGKVARGGLRWSDRKEDYRTEILGLLKAQQVKNAVIVPVGAKGGFIAKNITETMSRDKKNGVWYCLL